MEFQQVRVAGRALREVSAFDCVLGLLDCIRSRLILLGDLSAGLSGLLDLFIHRIQLTRKRRNFPVELFDFGLSGGSLQLAHCARQLLLELVTLIVQRPKRILVAVHGLGRRIPVRKS